MSDKKQAFNPYLPSYEYIPDGEPHIFGDRLYVFGSHDRFNGTMYCENDYVAWSAPLSDLADWRFEGVIYRKTQDPRNADGHEAMWAPDVCQGPDGRYYLYYPLARETLVCVAVCDSPAGQYQFYGYVRHADGTLLGEREGDLRQTDPGVLADDDGRVYLFSGGGTKIRRPQGANGSQKMELFADMLTIKAGPFRHLPTINEADGTEYEGHAFYEASSIRRVGDRYCFIYSSPLSHELCYAMSDTPLGEYHFGGILVSNVDIGFEGNTTPKNYLGNTHGSLLNCNGQWYIFYHRQTNRHPFSRQACAEPIRYENGAFSQARVSSCGLNGGPLAGRGSYEARIACHLWSRNGVAECEGRSQDMSHPAFTQKGEDRECAPFQYIENLRDGATAGFRSFRFDGARAISVRYRTDAAGCLTVRDEEQGEVVACIPLSPGWDWHESEAPLTVRDGVRPLYFTFSGAGRVDFFSFTIK